MGLRTPFTPGTPRPAKVPRLTEGVTEDEQWEGQWEGEQQWESEEGQWDQGVAESVFEHNVESRINTLEAKTAEMWEQWPAAAIARLQWEVENQAAIVGNIVQTTTAIPPQIAACEAATKQLQEHATRAYDVAMRCAAETSTLHEAASTAQQSATQHEVRITVVEREVQCMKERIQIETTTRDSDIRAIVDMMRREHEQQATKGSPKGQPPPWLARLGVRLQELEQSKESLQKATMEEVSAIRKELHQVRHEKQAANAQELEKYKEGMRMTTVAEVSAIKGEMESLKQVHQMMSTMAQPDVQPMIRELMLKVQALERKGDRESAEIRRMEAEMVDAKHWGNRVLALEGAMARMRDTRDQDLTRIMRKVQETDQSLAMAMAGIERRVQEEMVQAGAHSQGVPNATEEVEAQLRLLRQRVLHGEDTFAKAIRDTRAQLKDLQIEITQTSQAADPMEHKIQQLAKQVARMQLHQPEESRRVTHRPPSPEETTRQAGPPSVSIAPTSLRPELRLARRQAIPITTNATIQIPARSTAQSTNVSSGTSVRGVEATVTQVHMQATNPNPMIQILPPQLMESISGRHPGRFSGSAEDWPTWRRKWLPFMREIEGIMPVITDTQRLALLRGALGEAGAIIIDQEMEADGL